MNATNWSAHLLPTGAVFRFSRGAALLAALLSFQPVFGETAPPAVPAEIDGRWIGEARQGPGSTFVAFEFQRRADGRVLARLSLPDINAYGMPVGWVTLADGKLAIREYGIPLDLKDGVLTGNIYLPDLKFSVRRSTDPLPAEPELPAVGTGPAAAWSYAAGAPLWASPMVADGVAYVGDAGGKFHAVSVAGGRAAWTFDAGAPLYGAAAVGDGAVYFAADNGFLYKLDRKNGALLWRAGIGGAGIRSIPAAEGQEWDYLTAAPVEAGDTVFIGSADGTFHALAVDSGKPRWSVKTSGKIRAAALVAGARVFVGSMDHFVHALDRQTGAELWKFDTGSPVTTAPVLAGDKLIIGTRDQALLFALDATSGRKLWTVPYWMSWVESTPVLADGLLYIGASDSRRVRVIEPDTGKVRWAAQVWGWTWGTPVVVGDKVYYGTAGAPQYWITQKPSLGALDRKTGALKWRKPIPLLEKSYISGIAGSLAYADGKLLAANLDGTLTAYEIGR